jgi:hypothetical protein
MKKRRSNDKMLTQNGALAEYYNLKKILGKKGFRLQRVGRESRKTFVVNDLQINEFMRLIDKKNMKIKDAFWEAIQSWIEKNR